MFQAGLFSSVMTAFLVESYHNLSEDPAQVTILYLKQLTTQTHSYSVNAGFLSSTSPPLDNIPEFTPSANAIRVNALWFASLTLSLVSASFSILVKQWLQEYLAGEYTSSQARIRIRHFRHPGLNDWKVFEIAAILPLLLQLSLALFFVGLCFFTADVHRTVGHITLSIVAAWGLLFVAVSLAPALSPRCPYKTRLLQTAMKMLRTRILRFILWARDETMESAKSYSELPKEWSYRLLAINEDDVAKSETNDVDIFIAVDSIQTDEQLLRAMWDALQQTQPKISESCAFITRVIGHRLPSDRIGIPYVDHVLDLKRLPKRTVNAVMSMVAETLRPDADRLKATASAVIEWSPEMMGCLCIALSETGARLPPFVDQLLKLLLSDQQRYRMLFSAFSLLSPNPATFSHVLARLKPAIEHANKDNLLDILDSLMQSYFCSAAEHDHVSIIDTIVDHPNIPAQHVSAVVTLVTSLTRDAISPAWESPAWAMYSGFFLFQLLHTVRAVAHYRDDILELARILLVTRLDYCGILNPMFRMHDTKYGLVQESARNVGIEAAITSSHASEYRFFRKIAGSYRP